MEKEYNEEIIPDIDKEPKKENKPNKHHKKKAKNTVITVFLVILAIVAIINMFLTFSINNDLKVVKNDIPAIPKLQIFKVIDTSCPDCIDLTDTVGSIKSGKVNVTDEKILDFSSDKVKDFLKKYNIDKVPTIIITGEIDNYKKASFEDKDGFLVFAGHEPTYIDVKEGKIRGRVKVINVRQPACDVCMNLSQFIYQFKLLGINIVEEIRVDLGTPEGQELADKYNLATVPTLIFSPDIALYRDFADGWSQVGTVEKDGTYVMRQIAPPFYDLKDKNVKGLVSLTYLVDKTCVECYPISLHYNILTNPQGLAIKLKDEQTIDISSEEGQNLIEEYNITSVPTIILSEDAAYYKALTATWGSVGSVEQDGSYIFRNNDVLREAYKDLVTGELVKPEASPQQP